MRWGFTFSLILFGIGEEIIMRDSSDNFLFRLFFLGIYEDGEKFFVFCLRVFRVLDFKSFGRKYFLF